MNMTNPVPHFETLNPQSISLIDLAEIIRLIPSDISERVKSLCIRTKFNPELVPKELKETLQMLLNYHEIMVMAAKSLEILRNPDIIMRDVSFGVQSLQDQLLKARDFCKILFPQFGRPSQEAEEIGLATLGTSQEELNEFCIKGYLAEEQSWRDNAPRDGTGKNYMIHAHNALHLAQELGCKKPCLLDEKEFCIQAPHPSHSLRP